MADIEARREARRRRILENGESRLKRLRNVNNSEEEATIKENNILKLNNSELNSYHYDLSVDSSTRNHEEEITTLFERDCVQPSTSQIIVENDESSWNHRLLIIVILAMFIRYLNFIVETYSTSIEIDVSGFHVNKIFFPLFLYEIFEYVFVRPEVRQTSFLYTVLLLANIQPKFLHKLLEIFNFMVKFFQDLLVYFFTFIICDLVIETVFEIR